MKCLYCKSEEVVKAGCDARTKKRRYKCKSCNRKFVEGREKKELNDEQKETIIKLYTEGMSIRGIGRVLGFSHQTIYLYLKKNRSKISEDLQK